MVKTFSNENSTASEKVSALSSGLLTMAMAVNPIQNLFKNAGQEISVFNHGLGITQGGLTLATAAIAGLAYAGNKFYKENYLPTTLEY